MCERVEGWLGVMVIHVCLPKMMFMYCTFKGLSTTICLYYIFTIQVLDA